MICNERSLFSSLQLSTLYFNSINGRLRDSRAIGIQAVSLSSLYSVLSTSERVSKKKSLNFSSLLNSASRQAISVKKELPVEFDLGLLACFDPNPIDLESYQ